MVVFYYLHCESKELIELKTVCVCEAWKKDKFEMFISRVIEVLHILNQIQLN